AHGEYRTKRVITHGSLIFIEVFKIYKLLNLLKLEKLFFVGSPIVTTLGGSRAVIMAVYMVLFGLNFGQNRPFFALQKSNFGFAFENERTVRYAFRLMPMPCWGGCCLGPAPAAEPLAPCPSRARHALVGLALPGGRA